MLTPIYPFRKYKQIILKIPGMSGYFYIAPEYLIRDPVTPASTETNNKVSGTETAPKESTASETVEEEHSFVYNLFATIGSKVVGVVDSIRNSPLITRNFEELGESTEYEESESTFSINNENSVKYIIECNNNTAAYIEKDNKNHDIFKDVFIPETYSEIYGMPKVDIPAMGNIVIIGHEPQHKSGNTSWWSILTCGML